MAARLARERGVLGLGESPLTLSAWTGLEKTLLPPCRGFISDKEGCLGSKWVYDN